MVVPPVHILKLAEGMEGRKAKGFRVSPATAELVIEALKLYARPQVPSRLRALRVRRSISRDCHMVLIGYAPPS
jgi:hypothetical protein